MRSKLLRALALAAALTVQPALAYSAGTSPLHAVKTIADARLPVDTPQGHAEFPLYVSADWSVPQPRVERAVIVMHGRLRNADVYYASLERARAAAGVDPATTLLIAPQFLATVDTNAFGSPADLLRWRGDAWMGGEPAAGAVPVSSYAVLDKIVERLSDRHLFPALKSVVFAGHSGGGQFVQRYAEASHAGDALRAAGIDVRYLVANPSSYAYFDALRPDASGAPAPFDAAQCPGFNDWKYGMQARPAFMQDRTPKQIESDYVKRHIVYLIGGNDTNPQQSALDKSCEAQAQGPQRMARAQGFFRYLQSRHPEGLNQAMDIVPGVGHDGARMLTSTCALATMFDVGSCAN
ncbi:alpha/beta hydrolase [Paraburkholderia sp. J12]|uniref:alpha/beta hydrolase n=1 Tax=Paraburkholderia sp. J12 TaxID=2805432 RepID=UPI002ABD67DB|nr:alpha/beta hydrolase [Paraburkholderia sp. J12]